jgi:hypothetical protein
MTGMKLGATHELNEPLHAGLPGVGSVWYNWTAPDDAGGLLQYCAMPPDRKHRRP